jgi:hypothetical protein
MGRRPGECRDDAQGAAAAGAGVAVVTGRRAVSGRGRRRVAGAFARPRLLHQQAPALGEPGGAAAVGEKAEVPDAVEAGRQDVEQEAAHELAGVEGHDLLAALVAVVLPAEADRAVGHADEPAVGDGDAMGVAPEVGQHLLGPAERALGP